jgi:hypothetical protein
MTSQKSYERINYLIRPNKNIERKLVFETLAKLGQTIDLKSHRYIGFGSMWFADFLIAHRFLNLTDMWSIEKKDPARAEFNRPYKTIKVHAGTCSDVLKRISKKDWSKPCVAWLDYDGALNTEVKDDLETFASKAAPLSIIVATVNSAWLTYRPLTSGAAARDLARSTIEAILGSATLADEFSKPRSDGSREVSKKDFPEFLARSLMNLLVHKVTVSGRSTGDQLMTFLPLFSYSHDDGVEMATVGGILCPQNISGAVLKAATGDPSASLKHKHLDLIQLTIKEKLLLDRILPEIDTPLYYREAKTSGLKLTEKEISKYRECYRHFPVFSETAF